MNEHSLPETLRREIEADLQPVRPLAPPARRTAVIAGVSLLVMAGMVATSALRPDLSALPVWLGWGASLVELLLGLALVSAALQEGVPAGAVPTRLRWFLLGAAVLVHCSTAFLTWLKEGTTIPPHPFGLGYVCLRSEVLLALPAMGLTLVLVARAFPLRPAVAGLLGGAGAGLIADGVEHLLCPISDIRHVLVWHTGAIVLLMAAGWLAGHAWEVLRARRYGRTRLET